MGKKICSRVCVLVGCVIETLLLVAVFHDASYLKLIDRVEVPVLVLALASPASLPMPKIFYSTVKGRDASAKLVALR